MNFFLVYEGLKFISWKDPRIPTVEGYSCKSTHADVALLLIPVHNRLSLLPQ